MVRGRAELLARLGSAGSWVGGFRQDERRAGARFYRLSIFGRGSEIGEGDIRYTRDAENGCAQRFQSCRRNRGNWKVPKGPGWLSEVDCVGLATRRASPEAEEGTRTNAGCCRSLALEEIFKAELQCRPSLLAAPVVVLARQIRQAPCDIRALRDAPL